MMHAKSAPQELDETLIAPESSVGHYAGFTPWTHQLLAGSLASAVAVLVEIALVGRAFSEGCDGECMAAWHYQGCLSFWPALGVILTVFTIPAAAIVNALLITELGRTSSKFGRQALCCLALAHTVSAILAMCFLMKPWSAFDYAPYKDTNGGGVLANDVLQVFLGGEVFLVSISILVTALYVAAAKHSPVAAPMAAPMAAPASRATTPRGLLEQNLSTGPAAGSMVLLCCILTLLCSSLSPIWNYSFRSYSGASSPYSVLFHNVTLDHGQTDWHLCGEKGTETIDCDRKFTFKLFMDTVVFYTAMLVLIVAGASSRLSAAAGFSGPVAVLLSRVRVPWPKVAANYHPYKHGATIGELVLVIGTSWLYIWWLYYFRWGYTRIEDEATKYHDLDSEGVCCRVLQVPLPNSSAQWGSNSTAGEVKCQAPPDQYPGLQIWARTLGHLTTLSCSLLLLPATKNSVWFHILGVPFERALKYHRWLGGLTYFFVTCHMALWWLKWALDGTFWSNIYTTTDLRITPYWSHGDNFTIVLAELSWLALTAMIAITVFARRKSYEIFYYMHVPVGLSFLAAALIHAWSFWYYAAGGILLWTIDAVLRTVRVAKQGYGQPVSAVFHTRSGVTSLHFAPEAFEHVSPAQYVFLCIPTISPLERHPFTISSAPSAAERTLHIKSIESGDPGRPSFTAQLAVMVQQGGVEALGDVRIDGPYGSAGNLTRYRKLVLVAGGIGVTPIHSILSAIVDAQKLQPVTGLSLQEVVFVWTVRSRAELELFADSIYEASQVQCGTNFVYSFFVTRPETDDGDTVYSTPAMEWMTARVQFKRPTLSEELGDLDKSCAVFACGPQPLTDQASEISFASGAHFHSEIFLF